MIRFRNIPFDLKNESLSDEAEKEDGTPTVLETPLMGNVEINGS